ncbi:MAG: fibronectin type III-like domain-contianing protein, partial [Eubacteriales bacterium]
GQGNTSSYIDLSNYPKYEFGYGLSYSTFEYSNLTLSSDKMKSDEKLVATVIIKNTGKYAGEEIVHLYLRDVVSSIVRPVKELKDFKKIALKAGESKTITFNIDREKLSFYNQQLKRVAEPGDFDLMIGASSKDIRLTDKFELVN